MENESTWRMSASSPCATRRQVLAEQSSTSTSSWCALDRGGCSATLSGGFSPHPWRPAAPPPLHAARKGGDARAETIVATAQTSTNVSATSDGSTSNHDAAEAGVPSFLAAAALAKRCEKGWQGSVSAVRAAHILVDSREKALMVKREIDAGQLTFAQAAGQYSMDPSGKESGGDLGTFHPGDMVRALEPLPSSTPCPTPSDSSGLSLDALIKVIGERNKSRTRRHCGPQHECLRPWQLPLGMDLDSVVGKATIIPLTLQAYGKSLLRPRCLSLV